MRSLLCLLLLPALSLGCAGDDATTPGAVETPRAGGDLEDALTFARSADVVAVGAVRALDHGLSQPDAEGRVLPFTFVTWQVERGLAGATEGETITLRFIGGPLPDGRTLTVTEVPEFQVGDRDLLFVERNGEVGCPLVGGARGRLRLLDAGQRGDGLSPNAPGGDWLDRLDQAVRAEGLTAPGARSADPAAPFSFAWPRPATPEQMEAAAARARSLQEARTAPVETEDEYAERVALERNNRNPVLR